MLAGAYTEEEEGKRCANCFPFCIFQAALFCLLNRRSFFGAFSTELYAFMSCNKLSPCLRPEQLSFSFIGLLRLLTHLRNREEIHA